MSAQTITHGKVTWTNIKNPNSEDIESLRRNFNFHPLDLEDCLSKIERPKIDEYDDYLFIVMHFPIYDRDHQISQPSEVDFFIGATYLVTIHDGRLKPLIQLFEDCHAYEQTRRRHMGAGASRLLHSVIDKLVDYCFPILAQVDHNIQTIEDEVFSENMRQIVQRISVVRRDIIALRRIIKPQLPIVANLEHVDRPFIREDLDVYFGDIHDHLQKAWEELEDQREVLEGLSDTSESVISYRINDVMKLLTIISVVMLPLSLISGIYGMNVLLPGESSIWAFPIILGGMVIIALAMLGFFKMKNWL
ncbi:MAG: magnesium/cobalt transporter CorA [Anaerolineae bacterium]|nr:MAG: magnesium/cobalt transporter CorA [Anaerolineae bacterium]